MLPARLISVCLLAIAASVLYWFSTDDAFFVKDLRIKGSGHVTETELMAVSGIEGLHIFWVDTRVVERAVEALPDIASASVQCGLPADCAIQVVERVPLFVWRQGDAQIWIGSDGMVLPARGELPDAIVLDAVGSTALRPGDQLEQKLVMAVEELARLQPDIRIYQYTDQYGLSFRNTHGWLIRLGVEPAIETKLKVLDTLTEYLTGHGIDPDYVDVRFPEAPYYGE
jgi:cell division septal protein FtsQ